MADKRHKIETKLIHAGEPETRPAGAVVLPVYQSQPSSIAVRLIIKI